MLNRLRQQADVISAVNRHLSPEGHLAGLSIAAIHDWQARNSGLNLKDVCKILESVSREIGVLHDKSNPPKADGKLDCMEESVAMIYELMANKALQRTPTSCAAER